MPRFDQLLKKKVKENLICIEFPAYRNTIREFLQNQNDSDFAKLTFTNKYEVILKNNKKHASSDPVEEIFPVLVIRHKLFIRFFFLNTTIYNIHTYIFT